MSHKIFDNDSAAIRKRKVTLTLDKPAYVVICILDLSTCFFYKQHFFPTQPQCCLTFP